MATVPTVQLSSLTNTWSVATAKGILLAILQAPPNGLPAFPVTAWQEGGVSRTLVEADAQALSSLSATITQIAYAPYMQTYISPPATGALPDGWADLHVYSQYQLTRNPAVTLVGYLVLTDAANAGPFNINANQLWALASSSGLRFNSGAAFTLPKGGTISVPFTAEAAGSAYNVAAGAISTLATSLAGVTVANFYGPISNTGASSGKVVPAGTPTTPSSVWSVNPAVTLNAYVIPSSASGFFFKATTPGATGSVEPIWPTTVGASVSDGGVVWTCQSLASLAVKITLAGDLGTAKFQYSSDGGASYNGTDIAVPAAIAPASFGTSTIPTLGVVLNFQPGAGTDFAVNDVFSFSGATWISTAGVDQESSAALATRGTQRWAALGSGSPASAYQLWASTASVNVTRVNVQADAAIGGQVNIFLAGPSGPVGLADVAAVQSYINARAPLTASPVVASALAVNVTLTATVNVKAAQAAQAQAQATITFNTFIQGVAVGGTLYLSALIEQLMLLPGVVSVNMPVSSPGGDTVLSANQVAQLTLGLTWVQV